MKSLLLVTVAVAAAIPSFAQYSARTLTSKIVPQQQPAPPPRPAQQGVAVQAAPPRPLTEAEQAKLRLQKDKNEVKQFDFYKRRAEEGSDDAQYQLGMRYLAGKGTPPDEKLAREWFEKAAKQGHKQAGQKLAELGPVAVAAQSEVTAAPAPAAAAKK
jgi:hypothetical protein